MAMYFDGNFSGTSRLQIRIQLNHEMSKLSCLIDDNDDLNDRTHLCSTNDDDIKQSMIATVFTKPSRRS